MHPGTVRLKRLVGSLKNGAWGKDPVEGEGVFCVRAADFDYTNLRVTMARAPKRAIPPASAAALALRPGDIVLEKSGGGENQPVGRAVLFDGSEPAVCSNFAARLRPASGVDSRHLTYLLASLYSEGATERCIKQTTGIQNLDTDAWLLTEVPDWPIDTQHLIADFLDDQVSRIDEAVRLRREQGEALKVRTASHLSEQYESLVSVHGAVRLRYLGIQVKQGWSPQCDDRLPEPDGWGVLKAGAVNGGRFRTEEVKALPVGVDPRREFEVRSGDLLVNRASGSLDLIGNAAVVVEPNPRVLLCDKIYRLSAPAGALDASFFVHLWKSKQIRERLRLGVSGAEGMANSLPGGVIRDVPFPLMNISAQRQWARHEQDRSESVDAATSEMTAQIDLLQQRKRSLITAAVTGEFDVTTASGRGI